MLSNPHADLPANTLPAEVREAVLGMLSAHVETVPSISSFTIAAGGCINHGGRLVTNAGEFFVKWNDVRRNPDMFATEARGLQILAKEGVLRVPRVIANGKSEQHQIILLEFISRSPASASYWEDFAQGLARQHAVTSEWFGLEYDNYIGSLRQVNTPSKSWITFFKEERISRQLMLAEKNGLADLSLRKKFEVLFSKLGDILSEGKPALLHGDLWSGNLVTDENGMPCLIDPAVYFGNPEIELAYTKLFGGFDELFYESYRRSRPIESGFEDRAAIYNLYPLLVHLNLFGKKYSVLIEETLSRFC